MPSGDRQPPNLSSSERFVVIKEGVLSKAEEEESRREKGRKLHYKCASCRVAPLLAAASFAE